MYSLMVIMSSTQKTGYMIGCGRTMEALHYPLVMVHGIARRDTDKYIHPWGRIPEFLQEIGVKPFFGNTDAWGGIESNAQLLKATIDKVLHTTNSEMVNILAHSKGGIDSRYCIWRYDYGDRVASLTTISTPHHGSEIADFLFHTMGSHTEAARKILIDFGRLFGDVHPDIYNVNQQLTTGQMKAFNETVGMDHRVLYQVMYTTMNKPTDDVTFFHSYNYLKKVSGDNDGLVSERSARWGNNITKIPGALSHEQIIDHGITKDLGIDTLYIYLDIINELIEKGF